MTFCLPSEVLWREHRSLSAPALKTLPSGLALKLFLQKQIGTGGFFLPRWLRLPAGTVCKSPLLPRLATLPLAEGSASHLYMPVGRGGASHRSCNDLKAIAILVALAIIVAVILGSSVARAELGPILITGDDEEGEATPVSPGVAFEIGDTPTGEFTGFREVIEKQQLQQAGSSLAEVVATESGVQFKQSGGLGTHSSVSLRGASGEQVNVYLDGILLNEASGGAVNLSDLELMQAERVEVYKGTVPVQLGNSAIGGAINITTARAAGSAVTSLLTGVGSFGSSRASVAFRGPVNLLPVSFFEEQTVVGSISFRQSANDFPFLNDNGTHFNTSDDKTELRRNGQTRSISGFLKTGHRLGGKYKLEHALQMYDRSQGVANWRNTTGGAAQLDSDNIQWRSTLRQTAASDGWSSLWEVTGSVKNELFDDRNGSIGNTSQIIDSDTAVAGARGYWEKINDDNSLSLSLRLRAEEFESQGLLNQVNSTNAKRFRSDFSFQYNRYFNGGSSLVSASAVGFVVEDNYQIENFQQARADYATSALLPQLGFSHTLTDRWQLLGNASLQKRVPSFFELFGSQGLFVGNSSLSTETSRNFDLGVKWNSSPALAVDSAFSATYFHSDRDDLIVRTYTAQGVGRSQNLSRATARGLELSATAAWNTGFSLGASVTLQDTKNRSRLQGQTGKQLPGDAATDGALTAAWKNKHWKLEYEFKVNADRFYDTGNFLVAADQRLHGLSISRYWQDWRVDVELNNLTDQNYEDYNGYPRPGRAGFISLFYQPQQSSN